MNIFLRKLRFGNFLIKLCLILSIVWLLGCSRIVSFHDLHYSVPVNKYDEGIIVVIDKNTLENRVSIGSFVTGIINRWDIRPGEMLKQIADIEFPQMFSKYKQSDALITTSWEKETIFLVLTIPNYRFKRYHSSFTVNITVYNKEKFILLEKTYKEKGVNQAAKMYGLGVFGMKSAIRQSSLSALKKIFDQIRADLKKLLEEPIH